MAITSELGSQVKFFVFGDTKSPTRKQGDAGIDVFVPNLSEQFVKDLTEKNPGQPFRWGLVGAPQSEKDVKDNRGIFLYLPAHEDLLIPTYLKTRFPENLYLRVANKSGVSVNQKLIAGAGVIDSSYEGEILIHIFNDSNVTRFIEFGQKLVQLIPEMIDTQAIEVYYDSGNELFTEYKNTTSIGLFYEKHDTHRGDKGFGEGTGLK
jgi:dUTPase